MQCQSDACRAKSRHARKATHAKPRTRAKKPTPHKGMQPCRPVAVASAPSLAALPRCPHMAAARLPPIATAISLSDTHTLCALPARRCPTRALSSTPPQPECAARLRSLLSPAGHLRGCRFSDLEWRAAPFAQ
eukprot:2115017-Prymnesium_polylepis.1